MLSVCPSVCLSVCLSAYNYLYLSIPIYVCTSIYLYPKWPEKRQTGCLGRCDVDSIRQRRHHQARAVAEVLLSLLFFVFFW